MAKFKKKPVIIDAIRWTGHNAEEIKQYLGNHFNRIKGNGVLVINTLEGALRAEVGDYIIRGVQGEHYSCKPDIFEKTYEPTQAITKKAKKITINVLNNRVVRGLINVLLDQGACFMFESRELLGVLSGEETVCHAFTIDYVTESQERVITGICKENNLNYHIQEYELS